jgi:YVTN family beta-propeller protein
MTHRTYPLNDENARLCDVGHRLISVMSIGASLLLTLGLISVKASPTYTIIGLCHTENKIVEIDPASGTTLRTLVVPGPWTGETHEGAITADGKTMYVSTPYQKQVIVIDLASFTQKAVIDSPLFSRPPETRRFARIGARESTSSDPHGVALNNAETKLYVSVEFAEVPGIVAVDLKSGHSTKIDTIVGGNYLWVQPRTDLLYFPTRDNRVIVIDTKIDQVVRVVPVQGSPDGIAFAPDGEAWVNGDRDGSVSVIDPVTISVSKVFEFEIKGAGRTAVSADGRFAAATHNTEVALIEVKTKRVMATQRFTTANSGHGFPLFSPDSKTLHVLDELSGQLMTFDVTALHEKGPRTPVGDASFGGGIRVIVN